MKIELLYFEGCPSWQDALKNLKVAITADGLSANINLVQVVTNEQASQLHFLGSPSFKINNLDLWPEERNNYALSCRVYSTDEGLRGAPSIDMLRRKLREIHQN